MSIDFRNTNLIWTSILAETLHLLGLTTAIVCPGSRSAPLAIAFANHPEIEAIPVLDERSAAFFALGIARQSKLPVVLVCTSGTAGANFYPAVIEARESGVPLLVLTADRPPELRDCNAGQAIDQQKLYGHYPNWQAELALPSLEGSMLAYLRQTVIHAWERSLYPVPGPVHLNLPFRDPLAPLPQPEAEALAKTFDQENFFAAVVSLQPAPVTLPPTPLPTLPSFPPHGLIIAGPVQPPSPEHYCRAIAHLARTLGYPVLAEGLSPLRNYANLNPNLISTYDLILRNPTLAEKLQPEVVIRLGEMPTSKQLRTWLATIQPRQWVVDASGRNLDPLHGKTTNLHLSIEAFAKLIPKSTKPSSSYLELWRVAEAQARRILDQTMAETEFLFECKVAWLLSKVLPPETPLFISSSMPVRDIEFFWAPGSSKIKPFFNRGVNGIDGSLSTALGIAHRQQSSVMLTGDLALLHDTNGFLLRSRFSGHLTIVLIDNNGGGIFEMLPISQFEPPFETFFATPQSVNFAHLCTTYGIEHELITSWNQLERRLKSLPLDGIRVLEIRTSRKADALWRQNNLEAFAAGLTT
ncbi:2-succinyl-5-enolpyruvyl-6-hydroxy-3-cyclohexene-1-carboxylic-acid synthase [Leptothermofonsia sp. ETS-13]|uniref:2-succinyl-5-enolpyruvyl-6-hydroxy-3- cyclohexene-1-carboxylic-acid synthase n=1 Tax=Leptothermofonsia sp. ETS-13 TaxID=3035696 RepID=UPI003B9E07B7